MRSPEITLDHEELELLELVHFDWTSHDELRASLAPMAELARRLLDRGAIPEARIRYFTDPECNPGGRSKSRLEIFERNGTGADEIFAHPNFMKYLQYFIFGPDLPATIIGALRDEAVVDGHLSGEDIASFIPRAKAHVRNSGMDPARAAEEFFKLSLECGASPSSASQLRSALKSLRR